MAEPTTNEKLLRGVQMLHGAVFSKRAPLAENYCRRRKKWLIGIEKIITKRQPTTLYQR
jgi:hypothetical protein